MTFVRLTVLAVLISAAAASIGPSQGEAYRFHAYKWPGGVVPYYNAAPDQAWAVAQAVRAWDVSGAHIRFVAVPRASAKMVIEEQSNKVYCSEARASVGYVSGAHIVVFPAHGITHACNRYWAARVVAHELGHVLGLLHENGTCATMNSLGSIHGGATCEPKLPWEWRCRLLEPDDVAGVAAVYGGTPHPVRTPATCPLYRAISRPAKVVVSRDAATGAVTLAFVRPADSTVPVFVAPPQWRHHAGFALVSGSATCPGPDAITTAPRFRWNVPVSGTQDLEVPDSATSVCYAIWAIDSLGRPSDKPSTITVPGRG